MKLHRFALKAGIIASISACASSGTPREPTDTKVLTAEEVEAQEALPVEVMLQRKFPGVQVLTNSDGEIVLMIRGSARTDGTPKPPLYVINDMEVDPAGRGLASLVNPQDIESIRVLRGAEAAIYGIRGADGAIVIRTKGWSQKKE